jgi:hypothetical protein
MSNFKGTREETKEILSSLDSILKSLNETKSSSNRTNNYNTKHSSSSFQNKSNDYTSKPTPTVINYQEKKTLDVKKLISRHKRAKMLWKRSEDPT